MDDQFEDTSNIEQMIAGALYSILTSECDVEDTPLNGAQIRTFENDGVLSYDKGLVIHLPDRTAYALTIVRSR